ncbi:hypothetical protein KEM54_005171 [Ascosphaera aggregata]|nr:hypothetical protein KEM54_005171 [Ascosphaera aggregata]
MAVKLPIAMDIDHDDKAAPAASVDEADITCFVCGDQRRLNSHGFPYDEMVCSPLVGRLDDRRCEEFKAKGILPPYFHIGRDNPDNWITTCWRCHEMMACVVPSIYLVPRDVDRYIEADLADRVRRLEALQRGDIRPRTMPAENPEGCEVMLYVEPQLCCATRAWRLIERLRQFPKVFKGYPPALIIKAFSHALPTPKSDGFVSTQGTLVSHGLPLAVKNDLQALKAVWTYSGLEYTELLLEMWRTGTLGHINDGWLKKRKHSE